MSTVDYPKRTSRKKIEWEKALAINHLDPEKIKRDFHHDLHPRSKLWALCWQEIEWAKIAGYLGEVGINKGIVAAKRLSSQIGCELPDMIGNIYAIFEQFRDTQPIQRELKKLRVAAGKNEAALAQIGQPLFDTPPPTRHPKCQSISLTNTKKIGWDRPASERNPEFPSDLTLGQLVGLFRDAGAPVSKIQRLLHMDTSWTVERLNEHRGDVHLNDGNREKIELLVARFHLEGTPRKRKAG